MTHKYNYSDFYNRTSLTLSNANVNEEKFNSKSYQHDFNCNLSPKTHINHSHVSTNVFQHSKDGNLLNNYELNNNESNDGSGNASANDTSDEDWVAEDNDRKRHNRISNVPRNQVGSRKILTHRQSSMYDRSRPFHQYQSSSKVEHFKHSQSTSVGRPLKISSLNAHHSSGRRSKRQVRKEEKNKTDSGKSDNVQLPYELKKPMQCFGPGCTLPAARPDTKYCSDKCGLRLAIKRLEILLPESLSTYSITDSFNVDDRINCVANEIDKSRLSEINIQQCSVQDRLIELEMEHQALNSLIMKAQECKVDQNKEFMLAAVAKDSEEVDQMEPIICVTCSTEVSMRHALKHMEKCFQKMEGNTVFCANQKEQIMGTPLFCDAYDSQAKAYCKRLRVVCEHYKEPKLTPDTVCGSPLVRDVFIETGTFCNVIHNKCTKHFGWERLRRAKIDLERYRCLIQMDELMQEEERIRRSMSQRGGVLGIMLHRTIDHNPTVPVPIPSELKREKCHLFR